MGVLELRSITREADFGKALLGFLAGCVVVILVTACTTSRGTTSLQSGTSYVGRGSGSTPLEALSAAKLSAAYRAAADLVGKGVAAANRKRIEKAFRAADNPNAYVFNQTLKILKTGDDPISYEIRIDVNVDAVSETLKSLSLGRHDSPSNLGLQQLPPELKARVERDLNQMTYMVDIAEKSGLDPFLIRSATTSGDAYLADNGIPYVDSSQVEALRKDQVMVYEQETGKSESITQWIARKLHADIYIVIDGAVSSTTRNGRYFGSADVSLRIFEASTGSGLGAANYQSIQPSVSLTSSREAVVNALRSSVYQAMSEAVRQARTYFARDLVSGIGYDLIVINTPDDRAMSAFQRNLAARVRDVRLLSWSAQETRYRVTVVGTASDLQDVVYETARAVPGFSAMGLVTLRGRELTFDTGM